MALLEAVLGAGELPAGTALQSDKKAYSERLSRHLAWQLGVGLRQLGFTGAKPELGGPSEKEFQGGLGPKKVDVSYSDERHGLILALSVKTITAPPFSKNLKNRFGDLCTEAITLHMRFPYAVVGALFAFPVHADQDVTPGRLISTFKRATRLMGTLSGRQEYTGPQEKFEDVTMMLFQPMEGEKTPWLKLFDARTGAERSEDEYFEAIRQLYNQRNPHAIVGEDDD